MNIVSRVCVNRRGNRSSRGWLPELLEFDEICLHFAIGYVDKLEYFLFILCYNVNLMIIRVLLPYFLQRDCKVYF